MGAKHVPVARAVGTAKLAAEFLAAADRNGVDQEPPSFVTYFLIGHALELAFKAVLIAQGITQGILRNEIGHDLERAAKMAQETAPSGTVSLSDEDWERMKLLNPIYRAKSFEYLEPGLASLPVPQEVYNLASLVVQSVGQFVGVAVRASLSGEGE